jgi:phage gpG-like protein
LVEILQQRKTMALTLKVNMLEIVRSISTDKAFLNAFIPFIRQDAIKEEFGQRYIDKIIERLDDGLGIDSEKKSVKLKAYSPAYKKSEAFKAYGKDNVVNLKLTGAMRADIDVVNTTATSVVIGFVDKESEEKAVGHINGSGNLPVRNFWGLPKKEEQQIMKEVIKEFNDNDLGSADFEGDNG